MGFSSDHAPKISGDLRISLYRIVKFFALFLMAALIVKYALIDTVLVTTDQMAPTMLGGDRVCIFRIPYYAPFNSIALSARGAPVIMEHPLFAKTLGCLRVAGLSGDSMTISRGAFTIADKPGLVFGAPLPAEDALPLAFSPRDSMTPYKMPSKGDTINLDSLSVRDFFYASAMVRQENPKAICNVSAALSINGALSNDYSVKDFPLYKGPLNALPKKFEYDWFFWDRLKEYLSRRLSGKDVSLSVGFFMNATRVSRYVVKEQFVFLLADDWRKGFDSRYFGPVRARSIRGRVLFVLWSTRSKGQTGSFFRMDRLIKVVK